MWPRLDKIALTIVLLGTLLPTPGLASPAEPRVHVLRGVSTFTATTTSKTLVRFPEAVDFHDQFRPHYSGDGRVRGFILRKTGTYEQEGYRPVMQSMNVGRCSSRGCKARGDDFTFIVCFCNSRRLTGTWELYVIADGAPVTLTLRSKNLSGKSNMRVTEPVRNELKTLEPRVHEDETETVYSAGDFTELDEADFGMVGLWVSGEPHAGGAIGDCTYYEDALMPPEDVAFTPGCPLSDGYVYPYADPNAGSGGMIFTSASLCCPIGVGGWYATAAAVKEHGAVAFWIDF